MKTLTKRIVNRSYKPNKTGFVGVSHNRTKFKATIWSDYKSYSFGSYETPEEAAYVYDQAMIQLHNGRARTNYNWSKNNE